MTDAKIACSDAVPKRYKGDNTEERQERMRVIADVLMGVSIDPLCGAGWSATCGSADSLNTLESTFDYETVLHPIHTFEDHGGDHTVKPSKAGKPRKP